MEDNEVPGGAATIERPNPRPRPRVVEPLDEIDGGDIADAVELRPRLPRPPMSRRLVILIAVVSLLVVVFGGYGLTRSPVLDLDGFRVEGNARTPADDVISASGLERGSAMTDLNLDAARVRIEQLPWVDRAVLGRRWPGTVSIRIVERVPVAVVTAAEGQRVVVDRAARVLTSLAGANDLGPLVPIVVDAPAREVGRIQPDLSAALAVATALPADLRTWVSAVSVDERGDPQLRLRDGVAVVLGDLSQLSAKFVDLATVLTRVELKDICRINLSAVHTPAVVRHPNCG